MESYNIERTMNNSRINDRLGRVFVPTRNGCGYLSSCRVEQRIAETAPRLTKLVNHPDGTVNGSGENKEMQRERSYVEAPLSGVTLDHLDRVEESLM